MSVIASLLITTCAQSRLVRVSDGQGGWRKTWSSLGTFAGRLRPASSSEREVATMQQREVSHVLYALASEDIARGDQVVADGVTVKVLAVREPSRAGHHLEIDCLETQLEEQA